MFETPVTVAGPRQPGTSLDAGGRQKSTRSPTESPKASPVACVRVSSARSYVIGQRLRSQIGELALAHSEH
eukprot:8260165-Lingulodinium_polyedra.AAC.1